MATASAAPAKRSRRSAAPSQDGGGGGGCGTPPPAPFASAAARLAALRLPAGALRPTAARAMRPRLYDVLPTETPTHHHLRAVGERFHFTHQRTHGDVWTIAPERVERVSRTRALELLVRAGAFAWLHFVKADGTDREMWAIVLGSSADGLSVRVRDLELRRKEETRQFRKDRLRAFALPDGPYYIVRQPQ